MDLHRKHLVPIEKLEQQWKTVEARRQSPITCPETAPSLGPPSALQWSVRNQALVVVRSLSTQASPIGPSPGSGAESKPDKCRPPTDDIDRLVRTGEDTTVRRHCLLSICCHRNFNSQHSLASHVADGHLDPSQIATQNINGKSRGHEDCAYPETPVTMHTPPYGPGSGSPVLLLFPSGCAYFQSLFLQIG